jgi:hypothetical protein
MPESAVTIATAARTLGVSGQTVRDWLRQGAPCASPGGVGRGQGSLVVVADLSAWRARRAGVAKAEDGRILEHVAAGLMDVYRRDAGEGYPLHRSLGVSERHVAALLVTAYEHIHRRLMGADAEQLPSEIQSLLGICVESSHPRTPR